MHAVWPLRPEAKSVGPSCWGHPGADFVGLSANVHPDPWKCVAIVTQLVTQLLGPDARDGHSCAGRL